MSIEKVGTEHVREQEPWEAEGGEQTNSRDPLCGKGRQKEEEEEEESQFPPLRSHHQSIAFYCPVVKSFV